MSDLWTCLLHFTKRKLMNFSIYTKIRVQESCIVLYCKFSLSTHADWQGVDISLTVCVFCLFVRLRIYPPRIKLLASNFARWFISVKGRESPIFCEICSPEVQNRTNRPARPCCNLILLGFLTLMPIKCARHVDVGLACVDTCQSPKTDVLVKFIMYKAQFYNCIKNVLHRLRQN